MILYVYRWAVIIQISNQLQALILSNLELYLSELVL